MRRSTKILSLALASLSSVSAHAGSSVNIPDWVRQALAQTVPTYSPETKAVVLLDQTEEAVTGPGDYIEHYRRVVRILRPEGKHEGEFSVPLTRQEKVVNVHAWSIDSSTHEYELKDKDFVDVSPYSSEELYSDFHLLHGTAPAAAPGSVVGFEYTVRRHGWLNQFDWSFQEDIPVHDARFSVQLPAGWEYKAEFKAESKDGSDIHPAQTGSDARWSVQDVPAIEDEPRMPESFSLAGRMEVVYFGPDNHGIGSWDAMGHWYSGLAAGRRTPTPEITEKTNQLIAGKTDFDGKARALASFLQSNVRYVAIEIGIGGLQPHAAADVFHARYGDCKDKATLLSSMLQVAGIRSNYLVINVVHGMVDPAVASAASFDHVILAIEIPAGVNADSYHSVFQDKNGTRYLLFDPTDEYTPLGELRADLQQTYALLVTESGGELIRTPMEAPATNILARSGHFTMSPDGTLAGEVVETRSGDHATRTRAALLNANEQERKNHVEAALNRSLKGFTVETSDIQHLNEFQNNLVMTLKFAAPRYGQLHGTLMLVRPRVLGEKSFEVETKPRHYDFLLGGSSEETDTYEIELPPGYAVDDLPQAIKIDMGYASYQSRIEVTGSKIRYWREYIVRDLGVAPDRIAEFRRFEGAIGADETAMVVLKRIP